MKHYNIIKPDVLNNESVLDVNINFNRMFNNIGIAAKYCKWNGIDYDTAIDTFVYLQEDEKLIQDQLNISASSKFELIVSTYGLLKLGITEIDYKDKWIIHEKEFLISPGTLLYYGKSDAIVDIIKKSIVVKMTITLSGSYFRRGKLQ